MPGYERLCAEVLFLDRKLQPERFGVLPPAEPIISCLQLLEEEV